MPSIAAMSPPPTLAPRPPSRLNPHPVERLDRRRHDVQETRARARRGARPWQARHAVSGHTASRPETRRSRAKALLPVQRRRQRRYGEVAGGADRRLSRERLVAHFALRDAGDDEIRLNLGGDAHEGRSWVTDLEMPIATPPGRADRDELPITGTDRRDQMRGIDAIPASHASMPRRLGICGTGMRGAAIAATSTLHAVRLARTCAARSAGSVAAVPSIATRIQRGQAAPRNRWRARRPPCHPEADGPPKVLGSDHGFMIVSVAAVFSAWDEGHTTGTPRAHHALLSRVPPIELEHCPAELGIGGELHGNRYRDRTGAQSSDTGRPAAIAVDERGMSRRTGDEHGTDVGEHRGDASRPHGLPRKRQGTRITVERAHERCPRPHEA